MIGELQTAVACAVLTPPVKNSILRSDSGVPQSKDQVTKVTLMNFISNNPQISTVQQMYSEAGLGNIQGADTIGSNTENCFTRNQIFKSSQTYSPALGSLLK
jgi:hypothetical protein